MTAAGPRISAVDVPPDLEPSPAAIDANPALLRDLLTHAIRSRVDPANPAVLLSGGLDSAALLMFSSAAGIGTVTAFTMDAGTGDDIETAAALARAAGARHERIPIDDDAMVDALPATVRAIEAPIVNGLAVAKHLFFATVARSARKVLSGVGADEVLLGDPAWTEPAATKVAHAAREDHALALEILTTGAARALAPPRPAPPTPGALQGWALRALLPCLTLPAECATAAHAGVIVATPFLSGTLIDHTRRVPIERRAQGELGKLSLREALAGIVPDTIRLAPKVRRLVRRPVSRRLVALVDGHRAAIERLPFVRPAAARALLTRHARLAATDPSFAAVDRLVHRLLSLAILST